MQQYISGVRHSGFILMLQLDHLIANVERRIDTKSTFNRILLTAKCVPPSSQQSDEIHKKVSKRKNTSL